MCTQAIMCEGKTAQHIVALCALGGSALMGSRLCSEMELRQAARGPRGEQARRTAPSSRVALVNSGRNRPNRTNTLASINEIWPNLDRCRSNLGPDLRQIWPISVRFRLALAQSLPYSGQIPEFGLTRRRRGSLGFDGGGVPEN